MKVVIRSLIYVKAHTLKTLVDAETGEKIAPVSGIYNVKIKADRARLFHFVTD